MLSRIWSITRCTSSFFGTIRERIGRACEVLGRRVHSSSQMLSSVVKMICLLCDPRRIAAPSKAQFTFGHRGKINVHELMTQDTRGSRSIRRAQPEMLYERIKIAIAVQQ
jgi:hypothetical protein